MKKNVPYIFDMVECFLDSCYFFLFSQSIEILFEWKFSLGRYMIGMLERSILNTDTLPETF